MRLISSPPQDPVAILGNDYRNYFHLQRAHLSKTLRPQCARAALQTLAGLHLSSIILFKTLMQPISLYAPHLGLPQAYYGIVAHHIAPESRCFLWKKQDY